jgi:hypothetical protein
MATPVSLNLPAPVDAAGQPVPTTAATTGSESGTSGAIASPEAKAQMAAAYAADQGVAQAQGDVGAAQAELDKAKADAAAEERALAEQQQAELQAREDHYRQRLADAMGEADKAEQAYANHQFHNYWDTQSTGTKVMRHIATFLGGFAAGFGGGSNSALENINREIDRDFQTQRDQLAAKETIAKMRRARVGDVSSEYERELGNLKMKQAKAHDAVAAKALQMATMKGIPVAEAQNSVLVKQQQAAAESKRLEALQHYDKHFSSSRNASVTSTTPGAPKPARAEMLKNPETGADLGPFPAGFTSEQAADANKQLASYVDAKKALGELHALEGEGVAIPGSDLYQKREALLNRAINLMNGVEGNKRAPSKEEVEILQSQLGGRLAVLTGKGQAKLDETIKQLDQAQSAKLGGLGFNANGVMDVLHGRAPAPTPAASPVPAKPAEPAQSPRVQAAILRDKLQKSGWPANDPRRAKVLGTIRALEAR